MFGRWFSFILTCGVNGIGATLKSNPKSSSSDVFLDPCVNGASAFCAALTPPDREIQTPEANSRVDKTWGQGHWAEEAGGPEKRKKMQMHLFCRYLSLFLTCEGACSLRPS